MADSVVERRDPALVSGKEASQNQFFGGAPLACTLQSHGPNSAPRSAGSSKAIKEATVANVKESLGKILEIDGA
ncbi:MAG TPA: hypothetical protein VGK73_09740, partial [Polyangiaceae bacterium]